MPKQLPPRETVPDKSPTLSKLYEELALVFSAGFSGIFFRSNEQEEAIRIIAEIASHYNWIHTTWDSEKGFVEGIVDPDDKNSKPFIASGDTAGFGPVKALQAIRQIYENDQKRLNIANASGRQEDVSRDIANRRYILTMRNPHMMLTDASGRTLRPDFMQSLLHTIEAGQTSAIHVVMICPESAPLPVDCENQLYIVDHPRPDVEELYDVLANVDATIEQMYPRGTPETEKLVSAARGLTRYEASGAFALSFAKTGSVDHQTVLTIKENTLKKSGLVQLVKPHYGFDRLGGQANMKNFCLSAIRSPNKSEKCRAKGIIAAGVPGTGKSAFSEALAFELGWPLLAWDLGSMLNKFVGGSEERVRSALKVIDEMAPAILRLEELDKALAGANSTGDSGVGARMFGALLTWLQERTSEIFVCGNMNDPRTLMQISQGAFTRSGRWDATFFVDLPEPNERASIWDIWLRYYSIGTDVLRPNDTDWTGADIKECCNKAKLLDISLQDASNLLVPIAISNKENIDSLRQWADNKVLSSTYSGVYRVGGQDASRAVHLPGAAAPRRRAVTRR